MSVLLINEETPVVAAFETVTAQAKSKGAKKKVEEDDDLDEEDIAPAKKGAAKKGAEDDAVDDDDSDVAEDDDDWDPDFEEFDLPKSKGGKGDKDADEEEDFKPVEDEDLKELDLFADSGFDDDEEDDF